MNTEELGAEQSFALAGKCIDAVIFNDERIANDEITDDEMLEFLESMTQEQFKLVTDFIETMPKLEHTVKFNCLHCDHKNNIKIEGMQSFF